MRHVLSVAFVLAGLQFSRADESAILLNAGPVVAERETAAGPRALASKSFSGKRLHLVQFDGPIQPEWVDQLKASGLRIISYIPNNAYLVYGDAASHATMRSRAKNVCWEGAYLDDDKIQPRAKTTDRKGSARALEGDQFAVQLVHDPAANAATLALIDTLKLAPVSRVSESPLYVNVIVRLPADAIANLAGQPDVVSINIYKTPSKFDERQDIIVSGQLTGNAPSAPGYLAWLASKGFTQSQFTASGLAVDVTDSGVDNATTTPNHFALYVNGDTGQASRVIYNRLEGSANPGSTLQGCDGHGNINAHIVGGHVTLTNFPHTDSGGYRNGLGVCPFVKVGSSVIFDPANFTSPDYSDLASRAYRDGARISGNSWGADTAGGYDVDAQEYDALVRDAQPASSAVPSNGNQQMTFVFAAGNAGSGAQTVGSPGTAKNVLTVGAAENVHSHAQTNGGNNAAGNDGCTTPDTEANSANDVASFSSRGPCSDQRLKPEIQAPGTHITGGVAQQSRVVTGTGNDLACFSGEGVCALPGGGAVGSTNNFFPQAQQFYSTSSGTSHSTPCVAGGCALIYQWFLNQSLNAPSPAMLKAVLMNAARYMNGVNANDDLWSEDQGMGMMDLGRAFDGTQRVLRDQVTNDIFTASGQSRVLTATVVSNAKPFRATLAWTDAPGSTSGNAFNNDLNLTVVAGGVTYRGNVFTGANSAGGGSADARNNAESVFLPAGTTGTVVVTVSANNINSDGVPNFGGALDQDFALVIYNASEVQAPLVAGAGSALVAESCGGGNGEVDPGESVSIKFALSNVGSADTTNVVATLLTTGGVTAPSPAQSYGALLAGGAAVTNTYSFTATGECGATISATLSLDDGGNNLGTVSFDFGLGATSDSVTTNSNTGAITIPALGNASPYPSSMVVAGLPGTVTKVRAVLQGYTHTYPDDVDILLVSPASNSVVLVSAAGGDPNVSGVTLTFDDDAASQLPDETQITSGTYRPSNFDAPAFTGTAPAGPYGSELSEFNGENPNGMWKLFVVDAATGDSGSFSTGWKLELTVGEPFCCASNQPPILAAIGNKSVVESNALVFGISATDSADGDAITLTASNLPPGATFGSTNGFGSFNWASAIPVGVYTTSFYAADDDGVDSETITITVLSGACTGTNVINEGFDGSTTVPAGWTDSGTANDTVASHYQSAGNCRALGSGDALTTPAVSSPTQIIFYVDSSGGGAGNSGTFSYSVNGGGFTQVDSFVVTTAGSNRQYALDASPNLSGATNVRFRFNSTFNTWYLDDVRVAGGCPPGGGGPQTPPVLGAIGDQSVITNGTISFGVSAAPTDGDTVTLSASNLPGGASFVSTNENGSFTWANAGPAGVYTTSFYAVDDDGADVETILITVSPGAVAQSNVLVLYTFDVGTNFTPLANTSPVGLVASAMITADGSATNFGGNPIKAIGDTGFIGETNNYFSFTLTIDPALQFNLKRVSFDDQRSNTGPALWALRSSADGFAGDLESGGTHLTFATNDVSVSVAGLTNSFTVRILGQSAGAASGTWRIDNVAIVGDLVLPSAPCTDCDGDGLDDAWELGFFGSTTNADATSDSDGDGFSDVSEFNEGSIPTSAASLLEANAITNAGGAGFIVTWQSHSNRNYLLSRATNLIEGYIGIASNIAATPPANTYTDSNSDAQQFYKVDGKNGTF